ncbi:hypothetical protein N0V93_009700 [Gnomoniopsis smithogilvyi]|uniref:Uncharacterized protein n=1 Tax=Gnomoniopsis smithogilvyi TaxID=1191159 RepID=A0A9W9CTX7_9PEZI|nr:hypothetical protein N0V93_009700 [Gnomoniopsis smithogilvyi]
MGKASSSLIEFIEDIPEDKLKALPTTHTKIYFNVDYRLDMQGMTTKKPQHHNLQVQVNNGTTITTLKALAPVTVAGTTLVPSENPWTPAEIKADLMAKRMM